MTVMTRKVSRVNGDIEANHGFFEEALAGLDTLEEIAVVATQTLYSLIETDKIALAVIEDNILRFVSTIGERVIMDLNLEWPSINARTVRSRETQLVNDTSLDPDYFPGNGRDAVTMLSELCVPIIHKGRVLGTINLECRQRGCYSEEDARVVEAYARMIAEAVHRVKERQATMDEPDKRRRARIRSPTENYLEILEAVYDGVGVLNRIVYRVAIPWRRGKEMVNDLVEKEYLTKEKISAARYIYKITDKGVEALKKHEHAPECLEV